MCNQCTFYFAAFVRSTQLVPIFFKDIQIFVVLIQRIVSIVKMFIEFSKNDQHEQVDHNVLDQNHIDDKENTVDGIMFHTIVHY